MSGPPISGVSSFARSMTVLFAGRPLLVVIGAGAYASRGAVVKLFLSGYSAVCLFRALFVALRSALVFSRLFGRVQIGNMRVYDTG